MINKWFKLMMDELFNRSECPEFETLVDYYNCKVNLKTIKQVEKHLLDCELCNSVLEGLVADVDLKSMEENVRQITEKIQASIMIKTPLTSVATNHKEVAVAIENKVEKILFHSKTIFKTPVFRYSMAAVIILLILYGFFQNMRPEYYKYALLNSQEQELLMLSKSKFRGGDAGRSEFSRGAILLLRAEQKRMLLIPSFNQTKVDQAIIHFQKAFHLSKEPFYRNKYAYFLGKSYLMKSDDVSARKWLNYIVKSSQSAAYFEAAIQLIKKIE